MVAVSSPQDAPVLSFRPRHLIVALLLGAFALLSLILWLLLPRDASARWPDAIQMSAIGVGLAIIGLAGMYLALGRQPVFFRVLAAMFASLLGGVLGAGGDNQAAAEWCGMALFDSLLVATPVLYLWGRGLRLIHPDDPPKTMEARPSVRRFSLWGAMSAMTCLAVLLAVTRNLSFPVGFLYAVMVVCGTTAAIAWTAVGTLLSPIAPGWGIVGTLAAALLSAVALTTIDPVPLAQFDLMAAITFTDAAVTGAVVFALRAAGYRLRWPTYEPPPELAAPQSNHSSEQSNLG